ncbi:MAG: flagellar protein FlaG [Deltaproteobacteria bacterium]|nr:flagellar protein FlaG [Deltaproteobacteria bacterium]MBW2118266.1 flagellar protein FlaG [Deltaproteobacteria bacterium]
MLVEPVTVSGKGQAPAAQARLPAGNGMSQKGGADVKAEKQPDLAQSAEIVARVQKNLDIIHDTDLQFSVHEATGEVMVTVRDESSGKVIREIPPREVLNLAAKLDAMVGLIFDQNG